MRNILITGITGQDGFYLANQCLRAGQRVYGLVRRKARGYDLDPEIFNHPNFSLIEGDIIDPAAVHAAVLRAEPQEIYNLAAQSFVPASWISPSYTMSVNVMGLVNVLEAVRRTNTPERQARVYQASSSEMFGNQPAPQGIDTQMTPRSPYGVSKLAAHRLARVYRESYGLFVTCGILFNHESPHRGLEFVTRKIARGVAEIAAGQRDRLLLGNLEARRDWGYAGDYTTAMRAMLDYHEPRDWVLGSGESHSVAEFVTMALWYAGLEVDLERYVAQDPRFMRPAEIHDLVGDPTEIRELLAWEPDLDFRGLVLLMVGREMQALGLPVTGG